MPRTTSSFAAEGTALHAVASWCLMFGLEPRDFYGQTIGADGFKFKMGRGSGEVDPECMVDGLDWIREQPGELFVETRVALDPYMPGQFGTLDVGIWDSDTATLTIFDWKFGRGVPVPVVENEQLRAYALGFVETILRPRGDEPAAIRIIIEQPLCPGGARFGQPWEQTYAEMLPYGDVMREVWRSANDPMAVLVAGEKQCKFCDARKRTPAPGQLSGCATYDAFVVDLVDQKFSDFDSGEEPSLPENLTPSRRAHIVKHSDLFTKWLAKLHQDSIDAARAGNPDPGMKLVAGRRGDRKWIDEEAARDQLVEALSDEAFTRKLKTPAAAEKDLAPKRGKPGQPEIWAGLEKLITQDEGKPILVSADDDRPALQTVDDKFN